MNRHRSISRMSAGATLLAAGLALAGCSAGSSPSTSSPPSSAAGSAATGTPSGGSGSFTGTELFPVAVGNTWVYRVTTAGQPAGTEVNKITTVVPVAGGNRVTTTHEVRGTRSVSIKQTYLFGSDGSITVPLTSLGSSTFTVKSGGIVWPSQAQIDSGRPFHSTITATLTAAGQSRQISARVTVQGAGSARVTVPAGTYQATVIDETVAEKLMGISISLRVRTWMAKGTGPVKSQVSTNGSTISSEELKSFTKG